MLDAVGWLLAEIYDLWPSYGGMLVVAAALWFLLLSPLTTRRIGQVIRRARVRPEAARIQQKQQSVGAMQRELSALYARENADPGPARGLSLLLDLAAMFVLWKVLVGLGTLDDVNVATSGGREVQGPQYVEPESALWDSLRADDGQVLWYGIDLSERALAAPAPGPWLIPLATVLLYAGVTLLVRRRIATVQGLAGDPYPPGSAAAAMIALAGVALLLPTGLVMAVLTTVLLRTGTDLLIAGRWRARRPAEGREVARRPPERRPADRRRAHRTARDRRLAFQRALAEADRLAEEGQPEAATSRRVDAVTALIEGAPASELDREEKSLRAALADIVAARPAEGMALFHALRQKAPGTIRGGTPSAVLRARVDAGAVAPLAGDWAKLEGVFLDALAHRPEKVTPALAKALRDVPPQRRSSDFSRLAAERVLTWLDGSLELATAARKPKGAAAGLDLLKQLEFGGRSLSLGDIYCALGDLALADAPRGEGPAVHRAREEAMARYRAAARAGSEAGRERLAHQLAADGRRLLVRSRSRPSKAAGDANEAVRVISEAVDTGDDPAYRVLLASAEFLAAGPDGVDPEPLCAQLRAAVEAGGDPAAVALWTALVDIAAGRSDRAAGELRKFLARQDRQPSGGEASAQVSVLLAELEGDDEALVRFARRLLADRGRAWLDDGPADPWPMAYAVAGRDPELLAEMVMALKRPAALPAWLKLPAASALITRAAAVAAGGAPDEATRLLDVADRCLAEQA